MKPTNITERGCDPVSSNCVIWQGPKIECIDLCNGDNISTVIHKLATELCTLMDTFNLDNYDLACLNEGYEATSFKDVISKIITKICNLPTATSSSQATAPPATFNTETKVAVSEIFYYTDSFGDLQTSMYPLDYVNAVGNKVNTNVNEIMTLTASAQNHENRIHTLETAPPPVAPTYTIQTRAHDDNEAGPQPFLGPELFSIYLQDLLMSLRKATGSPVDIFHYMQSSMIGISSANRLRGPGIMSDIPEWIIDPSNLAQYLTNMASVMKDTRAAVTHMQLNYFDTDCDSVMIIQQASVVGTTELLITWSGVIPTSYEDNNSIVTLLDGNGNVKTLNSVALKTLYLTPGVPMSIPIPDLNAATDIKVTTLAKFIDPVVGSTCESILETIILSPASCPTLVMTADQLSVTGSFNWNGASGSTILVQLFDQAGVTLIQTTTVLATAIICNFNFNGLTDDTVYSVRLLVLGESCDFQTIQTLAYPCTGPALDSVNVLYVNPTGAQTGATIEAWVTAYNSI